MNHHDAEPGTGRRLLILSCSQRKRVDPQPMPAIERYDGPRFRVLRKYLRQRPDAAPDVLILSARFGMIRSERMIPHYDQLMTAARASELQSQVAIVLGESFIATVGDRLEPEQLMVCMSQKYVSAFDGVEEPSRRLLRSCVAEGRQGRQLARLKEWLHGGAPPVKRSQVSVKQPGYVRLAGVSVALTRDEAFASIRRALANEGAAMPDLQVWCVKVDGSAVPVKWLVSRLTGVPVQAFNTSQARAVLARLGITAEQC